MDEHELQERLRQNPSLSKLNPGLASGVVAPAIAKTPDEVAAEAAAMLESKLQSELKRIALRHHYLYYHTHDSRRSDEGFPDTVLLRVQLRTAQLYFVECKRQGEEPTDKQKEWIEMLKAFRARALEFAGMLVTVDVFVWKPMDLLDGTLERTLNTEDGRTTVP